MGWLGFRVSWAEQRLAVGTKETPLDPGPGQEGEAGAPQARPQILSGQG